MSVCGVVLLQVRDLGVWPETRIPEGLLAIATFRQHLSSAEAESNTRINSGVRYAL